MSRIRPHPPVGLFIVWLSPGILNRHAMTIPNSFIQLAPKLCRNDFFACLLPCPAYGKPEFKINMLYLHFPGKFFINLILLIFIVIAYVWIDRLHYRAQEATPSGQGSETLPWWNHSAPDIHANCRMHIDVGYWWRCKASRLAYWISLPRRDYQPVARSK